MKRTKERLDYAHPQEREGISGLTFFDGEDNHKPQRTRQQIEETKVWIDLQNQEKKSKDEMEAYEKKMYGRQDINSKSSILHKQT